MSAVRRKAGFSSSGMCWSIFRRSKKVAPVVAPLVVALGFGGAPGVASGGGSDTLVDAGRIVMNDSGSTWNQEAGWSIRSFYEDGVVTSSHDLVVKLDSDNTEFTTQVLQRKAYASGCLRDAEILFRIPANKMVSGSNSISIYKRTQARSTTSGLSNGDISGAASLAPKLRFTSTRDYGNNADGSGTFDAVFNDYFNSGNPHHMEFHKGPVCRVFRVSAVAKDTTGGAAHGGGLYGIFWMYAYEASGGGLLYAEVMPANHMGDIDSSDPDVRRYDLDFYMGGSVVAGAANGDDAWSDQFLCYYSKAFASDADGRPFYSAPSKKPPFRNVAPNDVWMAGNGGAGLRVIAPTKATEFNSSDDIWDAPSFAFPQTIATVGANKGKLYIPNQLWMSNPNGSNCVRIVCDSAPGAGGEIVSGKVYHVAYYGGDTNYFNVYETRNEAGANSGALMQGTISAGTNVVVYPAHSPMSMPAGTRFWGSTGERTELGHQSALAWAAFMQPDADNYRALRCNALAQAYVPFQYRGQSTFRVPDIMTDTTTYSGLGTGRTSGITTYSTGGSGNIATPTAHVFESTEADWYLDGKAQFFMDNNHTPNPDYAYIDLLEPRLWYGFDIALPFAIGANCLLPVAYRNSTWDGETFNCGSFGNDNNIRSHASILRGWRAVAMSLASTVVAGTFGERTLADAVFASNTGLAEKMADWATTEMPNRKAMGIFPLSVDASGFANWQLLYLFWELVLWESHTQGELSAWIDYVKPYALALGGEVPGTASGTMDPTQGGGYYELAFSMNGSGDMDAPALQWDAFGHGVNSISVNATNNTITATLQDNLPAGSDAPIANGDTIVFLEEYGGGSIMGGLSFDTAYLARDVSLIGLSATFKLENSPGSGAIDITNTTFTGAWMVIHHQAPKSSGFWNNDQDGVAAAKAMAAVYAIAWARPGMNDALETTDTAMSNYYGAGTDPGLGQESRYCFEKSLCLEAT